MSKKKPHIEKVSAFTILEALLVMALLSILIAFFFNTMNSLGEQTKNEVLVKGELNNWFAFRANLFSEFDEVDSLETAKEEMTLYIGKRTIRYVNQEDYLIRIENGVKNNLDIPIRQISEEDGNPIFLFDWKGDEMKLAFNKPKELKLTINDYFNRKEWQKN